jgi:hypothetical protein
MQAPLQRTIARWRWLAIMPLVCCLSCSSSESLNPVQGKVLYKDEPLKGVLITFHPKAGADMNTVLPLGLTGEDGSFTVSTGETEGAPVGEYIITFICSEEVPPPKGQRMSLTMGPVFEDRFRGAYAEKSGSKLQIEIKSGPNQLEPFRLK